MLRYWRILDGQRKVRSTCKPAFSLGVEAGNRLTRNEQVSGSSPLVGSLESCVGKLIHARDGARRQSRTSFLLSSELKGLFRLLHSAYIGRTLDQLDPFIVAQYGTSMHAWAESQSLYWLTERRTPDQVPNEGLRIWSSPGGRHRILCPPGRTALLPIGRGVTEEGGYHPEFDILPIDGATWTLHSNDASLREAVASSPSSRWVVLFHNFPKRLKKFSKDASLNCDV